MLFVTTASDGAGEVSIAVVVDGDRVTAYACADDAARDPYPGWFTGRLDPEGRFALTLSGWSFSGSIEGDAARGTIVEPDGTNVVWSSAVASHAPVTGVYTSTQDPACSTSVIVIADDPSRAPVVRGVWCNVMQVTPVMPLELVGGRLAVDVAATIPWRLYVAPVTSIPPQ